MNLKQLTKTKKYDLKIPVLHEDESSAGAAPCAPRAQQLGAAALCSLAGPAQVLLQSSPFVVSLQVVMVILVVKAHFVLRNITSIDSNVVSRGSQQVRLPLEFSSLGHATESCDDPGSWKGDIHPRPLHHGTSPCGCEARTAGAELPKGAPSPLCYGGLGHLACHLDLSAASLGVGFSSAEPRDEVPPGADSSIDWPDLPGGVVGAFPRPFGPGSRRRFGSEGLGQAGVG